MGRHHPYPKKHSAATNGSITTSMWTKKMKKIMLKKDNTNPAHIGRERVKIKMQYCRKFNLSPHPSQREGNGIKESDSIVGSCCYSIGRHVQHLSAVVNIIFHC